ncbi:MAG: endonuclease [Bacteroidetes bacterium]|nr:endonuclease [Bacteroidota bacterium]
MTEIQIQLLEKYKVLFSKLRRDKSNGGAPHKPILLISLIQAYQKEIYTSKFIDINVDIVSLFKSNWASLVTSKHSCIFTLPFFHLRSEPFWSLVPKYGYEEIVTSIKTIRSFNEIKQLLEGAIIAEDLLLLMLNGETSNELLNHLLVTYFSETKSNYKSTNYYLEDIENQIVLEPEYDYKKRIEVIETELSKDEFQEEIFVRGSIFKREIPKLYSYTCCISGLRVDSSENISIIDACHIVPFSESKNDKLTNGLALCPLLHRAFDRGLISISTDYRVIINKNFEEIGNSSYSIKQFENVNIILPQNELFYPSIESLRSHNTRFF